MFFCTALRPTSTTTISSEYTLYAETSLIAVLWAWCERCGSTLDVIPGGRVALPVAAAVNWRQVPFFSPHCATLTSYHPTQSHGRRTVKPGRRCQALQSSQSSRLCRHFACFWQDGDETLLMCCCSNEEEKREKHG